MQPLFSHFITITDPRSEVNKAHKLIDILMVAVCAVLAGAESFVDMEDFGNTKQTWFKTFLELPNGIPSHDTFGRVFSLLDPNEFQTHFSEWMQSAIEVTNGSVIAIDGKTNRRTFGKLTRALPLRMVLPWGKWLPTRKVTKLLPSRSYSSCSTSRDASLRLTRWAARVTSRQTS